MSIALQNRIEELERRVARLEETCSLLTDRCRELGCDVDEALNVAQARPVLKLSEKRKSA